ncbi:cob(I)yrinic acid a,c-diamide adenosyltransferase [[Eubacterium] cellulosolvens]
MTKSDTNPDTTGLGLVQVYTGTGKGKTTAALGLGLRALGKGFRVCMIQFMKGDIEYGELTAVRNLHGFEIEQYGRPDFVDRKQPAQVDIDLARQGFARAKEILEQNEYDIVILDEINVAVDWQLLPVEDVISLIKMKPEHVELILTGRYAHPKIIELADLVTNMEEVKHPYHKGILARDGIEH